MVWTAASAALIAWLPGAVVFRAPWGHRDRRATLTIEERAFWQISISLCWSLTVVLVLAACGQYRFERLLAANAGLTVVIALASLGRLRLGAAAARPTWTLLIPLALLALGSTRVFPVSEYIIGGKDPGVYINEGIQIAQRGSLVIREPLVAEVPPYARELFFPPHYQKEYYGNRFMGIFVQDPAAGTSIGQFPHLYPASIAIGYGLNGLSGARDAIAWWALLGLLAVYFLACRWTGPLAAGAATTLLALHVSQVWFSRYPNSDIVMQAGLFTALLAFARSAQDDDWWFAPVAAWAIVLQAFGRVEALLGVVVMLGVALLSWAVRREPWRWRFVVLTTAGSALALWYLTTLMQAYFWRAAVFLENLPAMQVVFGLGAAVTLILAMILFRRRVAPLLRDALPVVIAATVTVLAVYAYWFREPGGKLTDFDAYALRNFVDLYLSWPMAVAAIAGLWLMRRDGFWRDPAFVLTWTAFSLFLLYKLKIVPEHFWLSRRFIGIILPGALVIGCHALFGMWPQRWTWWQGARTVAALLVVGFVGRGYVAAAAPVMPHVEYRNIIPYLERMADQFGPRDLVLVEGRDAQSDLHVLGLPLAYIYAKPVLVLNSARPDPDRLRSFLEQALPRFDRILFVGTGGTSLLTRDITATPLGSDRVQIEEFEVTRDRLPREVRRKEFDYGVYQLHLGAVATGPALVDIGDRDDLQVVRFFAKEQTEGRTIRWTQARSDVTLPGLSPAVRDVVLTMGDGGRPAGAPAAAVEVQLNGVSLGRQRLTPGFADYRFPIPTAVAAALADALEPATLRVISTVWSPKALLGVTDDRQLGVMLDRIEVR